MKGIKARIANRVAGQQIVRIAHHCSEHVVEVVGDAARQRTDGLHFLRMRQTVFQLAVL